ncbi:MAG: PRTRC system protein B [Pseudomonadota bacterium]
MNHAQFLIRTRTDGILRLAQAVLIYRGRSDSALATVHDVTEVEGEPVILAGKAMTPRSANDLARALARSVTHGGFVPETVLYVDGDLLLWWLPPAKRHIVFRAPELGAPERGEVVPQPGLVFAASSTVWKVWAVKGKARPTPDTALFRAPYFNVWADGAICRGNVPVPEGTTVERIAAWNDAFLCSYFTHPPGGEGKLVRYRGGAYPFWRAMLDGQFKRFPERVLVDAKCTLGALLGMEENSHA